MQLQDKVKLTAIYLWSLEDYHRMSANGLLTHNDWVELLQRIVFPRSLSRFKIDFCKAGNAHV